MQESVKVRIAHMTPMHVSKNENGQSVDIFLNEPHRVYFVTNFFLVVSASEFDHWT